MLTLIKLPWLYFGCIVVLLTSGVFIGASLAELTDKQQEILDDHETTIIKWETKYKKLLKTKRIIIPIYKNDSSECEKELDKARNLLEGIKVWCDPTCPEELNNCFMALQYTQKHTSTYPLF